MTLPNPVVPILFLVIQLILYLSLAVVVALVVYAIVRRTRGLGGQDTAEILVLQKDNQHLLEEVLNSQKETNRLLEELVALQKTAQGRSLL